MTKRTLNILVSIIVAGLFIWLAIRNIDLAELWAQIRGISLFWIPGFVMIVLMSHFFRAERWRLLLKQEQRVIPRSSLFAGVMLGYFVNTVVPRLGEVSRPVYVAKKHNVSSSNLLGTIVIERIIDVCSMLLLFMFIAIYISRDFEILEQIFGTQEWSALTYLIIPGFIIAVIAGMWAFYRILAWYDKQNEISSPLLQKVVGAGRSFGEGMVSVRHVDNWPAFLVLTAGIWLGYIFMTYIPFYMMELQAQFGLSLADAVVLTMVSSIGVSIPTPGGIGSYHLLIQQSMNLLYEVPLVTALTYATIAHAASILTVMLTTPLALWWDKYYTLKTTGDR